MLDENLDEIAPEQYKGFVGKALDKAHAYAAQLDMFSWLRDRSHKKQFKTGLEVPRQPDARTYAEVLRLNHEESKQDDS